MPDLSGPRGSWSGSARRPSKCPPRSVPSSNSSHLSSEESEAFRAPIGQYGPVIVARAPHSSQQMQAEHNELPATPTRSWPSRDLQRSSPALTGWDTRKNEKPQHLLGAWRPGCWGSRRLIQVKQTDRRAHCALRSRFVKPERIVFFWHANHPKQSLWRFTCQLAAHMQAFATSATHPAVSSSGSHTCFSGCRAQRLASCPRRSLAPPMAS
ncbi:hypothetical protein ACVILL_001216 [Bradyrhizobium sp. USDA 3364]